MKTLSLVVLSCAALLATASAVRPAFAWSRPILELGVGKVFGGNSKPNDGGMSAALSPVWPVGERARFGATLFVDDIGTTVGPILDANSREVRGLVAERHRWTWGAAWSGDYDVVRSGKLKAGLSSALGWWRIEDDVRGSTVAAASAVGFGLGANVRRSANARHDVGLVLRYLELTSSRHSAYQRVNHYATAGLEWRWTGPVRP